MATSQNKTATAKKTATKSSSPINNNLETQFPLSEKDEVKKAEQKTNKAPKNKS